MTTRWLERRWSPGIVGRSTLAVRGRTSLRASTSLAGGSFSIPRTQAGDSMLSFPRPPSSRRMVKDEDLSCHRRVVPQATGLAVEGMGDGQIEPDGCLARQDDLLTLAGQLPGPFQV